MNCPYCGNAINDDATFCPYCGNATPSQGAAPTPSPSTPGQPPAYEPTGYAPPPYGAAPVSRGLPSFLFAPRLAALLDSPAFFLKGAAWWIYLNAALIGLAGLLGVLGMFRVISDASGLAMLAAFVVLLFLVAVTYLLVHLYLLRGNELRTQQDVRFPVSAAVSLYLRLMGETAAIYVMSVCLFAFTVLIFTGSSYLIPDLPFARELTGLGPDSGSSFISALILLVVGTILSFFILSVFYFFSERVRLSAETAENVRRLASTLPSER